MKMFHKVFFSNLLNPGDNCRDRELIFIFDFVYMSTYKINVSIIEIRYKPNVGLFYVGK